MIRLSVFLAAALTAGAFAAGAANDQAEASGESAAPMCCDAGAANDQAEASGESAGPMCCDAGAAAAEATAIQQAKSSDARATLQDLGAIAELKDRFNADHGRVRMIVLLSPTCPMCICAAEWVQEHIMDTYADADFAAYVVWLPVLPRDDRDEWNPDLIDDPRALEFWDEERVTGYWFQQKISACRASGTVSWDVIYVFDEEAAWDEGLPAPEVCGRPICTAAEHIRAGIEHVLKDSAEES